MKSRAKTSVLACALACVLAGSASGVAAQEDCNARIAALKTVGDVQAALNCVQGHITAEAERSRQIAENYKKQLVQQFVNELELVTTNVRHVSLKETTHGSWKQIPDSADANACFLSSVRLPPQGLCQVTYQGTLERWAYNVSDPASAGFTCTATCVWMAMRPKPQAAK